MTTLAKDKVRRFSIEAMDDIPVVAADIIYSGAAVGQDSSGNARPLVALDPFRGFCVGQADNSAGAAAAIRVHVVRKGGLHAVVDGINSADDVPSPVYMSDDDTLTTTRSGNSYIGKAVSYNSLTGEAYIEFNAVKPLAAIADASTAHALNATFSDTEAEAALNALGTKINVIIDVLEQHGLIKPS